MEFNDKEAQALVQFRTQLDGLVQGAEEFSPFFLIRWLRARNLDLKKAKEMLLHYMDWINKNKNLPAVMDWTPPQILIDGFQYKFLGMDNSGRPVIWMPIGRYEVKKILEHGYKDDCFRLAYQILDEIIEAIEISRGKTNASQFIGLLDMAELSLRKFSVDALRCTLRFFRELEMYYPELIHSVYVINAHYIFSYVYNMVAPIMSAHTMAKVRVFDSNEAKWKPVLQNEFPCEIIPIEYGGTGPRVLA